MPRLPCVMPAFYGNPSVYPTWREPSFYPAWRRTQILSRLTANPGFIPLGGKPSFYPAWRRPSVYPAWRQTQVLSRLARTQLLSRLARTQLLSRLARTQVLSRLAANPVFIPLGANPAFIPLGGKPSVYPAWRQTQVLSRLAATQYLSRLTAFSHKNPRGYPTWHCLQRFPRGSEEQGLSEVVSRTDHTAVFGFFIGHRAVLDCAGKLFGARTGECADAAASRRRYRGRHRCRDNAVRRSHHHQFRQQDS